MNILGINYGGHDTSACIIVNGKILAACEQERYDGIKHSRNFPINAIQDCLKISGLSINQVDIISFGLIPQLKIRSLYLNSLVKDPDRINIFIQDIKKIDELENIEKIIREKTLFKKKIEYKNHHLCHLASAFYPSGFEKSLITSYDGIGEINSALFALGKKDKIKILHEQNVFPNSLGLIYSAVTHFLGWRHHCDEGIIMGLAPFGDPFSKVPKSKLRYIDYFRKIIFLEKKDKLSFIVNKDWISYHQTRDTWVSEKFIKNFGNLRGCDSKINQHHKNIASALQLRIEEIVLYQLKYLKKKYKSDYLCIAGGVGLNCSLNGKISRSKIFKKIFVQPASGDAGVAYGACLLSYKNISKKKIILDNFYLGHRENNDSYLKNLKKSGLDFKHLGEKIYNTTAELISEGKIIAWFQDGAEFGPRALGNRSILCKPYPSGMKDYLNKKVKFRENFRPFAPSVLEEDLNLYFDIDQKSEHMLIACLVKKSKKKIIPAVVHIDDTCRVQSVSKKNNLKFWKLINEFKEITGISVLLNTSFNVKGYPIVNSSADAIKCFLKHKIDYLVLGNFLVSKKY
jgi:carbamoyltransferase